MKKGIIFDLDGTLWDSSLAVVDAWNDILKDEPDVSRKADIYWMQRLMGKTMTDIENEFFDYLPKERRRVLMKACLDHENEYIAVHGGVLFDGVEDVLKELKKTYCLFIVSNCQRDYIPSFYTAHGLGKYFDDYEEFERTGKVKADNIRLVFERNGLDRAFYIGDTMGDYNSTMEAGLPFLHAAYGFGKVPEGTMHINDIRELPKKAEEILGI